MIARALSLTHTTPIANVFSENNKVALFDLDSLMKDVHAYFVSFEADAVIITKEALAIGILTLKDMVKSLTCCDNLHLPVKNFMTSPITFFPSSMSIAEVLESINDEDFDKIVVIDQDEILGVMDRRDLLSLCYAQLTPLIKHEYNFIQTMMEMTDKGEQKLLQMATTDTLTGIGNRRLLEDVFQAHRKLKERYHINLFMLLFDIDGFKPINDTFGHNVGDAVLKEMALLVSRSIRKSDLFVRWGGEEFAILLRYSEPVAVMNIAEQIRRLIDQHSFEKIVHVTCSFGLTSVLPSDNLENVIERADQALYRAKKDGKNCVRMEMLS